MSDTAKPATREAYVGSDPNAPEKVVVGLISKISETHEQIDMMKMTWAEALAVYHALGDALIAQTALAHSVPPSVIQHIRSGRKILAIRDIREHMNCGLAEAKSIVDRLMESARTVGI